MTPQKSSHIDQSRNSLRTKEGGYHNSDKGITQIDVMIHSKPSIEGLAMLRKLRNRGFSLPLAYACTPDGFAELTGKETQLRNQSRG